MPSIKLPSKNFLTGGEFLTGHEVAVSPAVCKSRYSGCAFHLPRQDKNICLMSVSVRPDSVEAWRNVYLLRSESLIPCIKCILARVFLNTVITVRTYMF
jgi:hypothetical protein